MLKNLIGFNEKLYNIFIVYFFLKLGLLYIVNSTSL